MPTNTLIASNACIEAGEAIMKVYHTDFAIEAKADQSPITLADRRANTIIQSHLQKTGIPIISEENEMEAYSVRRQWNKLWMVDPLDGTKEFIRGNGEFTVNIALVEYGRPVLGVIYVPVSGRLFIGEAKRKRTLRVTVKHHRPLNESDFDKADQLRPPPILTDGIRVVISRSNLNEQTKVFLESLRTSGKRIEITRVGSSLKFCLLAEGKAELYPRFGPSMEWDTAAGQVICEAAGINVISTNTQQPLHYNKENLFNSNFIVSKVDS